MKKEHLSIFDLKSSVVTGVSGRRGFSMIEVLISVAIVAVLVAVLMPAWKFAKRSSDSVQCSARLKRWGQMIHLYAADHEGTIAMRSEDGKESWASSKGPYAPYISDSLNEVNALTPKLRNCPGFSGVGKTVSYAMNYPAFNDGSYPPRERIPLTRLLTPSRMLLMVDAESNGGAQLQGLDAFEPYVKKLSSEPYPRHAGGVNGLFADGHVAKCRWDSGSPGDSDTFVAQKNVWFVLNPEPQ